MEEIQDDVRAFLSERHNAIVATKREDAPPHLSPVWYLFDGARFYISVKQTTAKYRNLERDPQISLCIDSGYPNWEVVIVSGVATLMTAEDPRQPELRRRILARYYDSDEEVAAHIEHRTDDPTQLAIIVVEPAEVIVQGFGG